MKKTLGVAEVNSFLEKQLEGFVVYHLRDCGRSLMPTSQRLLTAFLGRQPRTGEPVQWCCRSSHFPYQGGWQSIQTSTVTPHAHTSAQSACKSCSIFRTQPVLTAIGQHSGSPISQRRRNDGNLPRFPHIHSGPASRTPEFLSIVRRLVSHRSCHHFIRSVKCQHNLA